MSLLNNTPPPDPQKVIPIQDLNSLVNALADSLFNNTNFLEQLESTIAENTTCNDNFEDELLDKRDVICDIVKEDVVITIEGAYLSS